MQERSRFLGRVRLAALYAFIGALVVLSRPDPFPVAVGAVLVAIGEGMRIWAAGHLVKSTRLITSGPYAYTQNPLYLGRLLILTGLAISARAPLHLNLVVLAAGYAIFFLYYMPRKVRVEGARLGRIHGQAFETYHRNVPILFPRLRRNPSSETAPWSFRLMVRNQEPFVLAGILAVMAALVWKAARN